MAHAQTIAEDILAFLVSKMPITPGTREDITKYVTRKIEPLAPSQTAFHFEPARGRFKTQAAEILALLKKRRSEGAKNWELSEISLKYTSRVSDLRALGYRITCDPKNEAGVRTYRLSPLDW